MGKYLNKSYDFHTSTYIYHVASTYILQCTIYVYYIEFLSLISYFYSHKSHVFNYQSCILTELYTIYNMYPIKLDPHFQSSPVNTKTPNIPFRSYNISSHFPIMVTSFNQWCISKININPGQTYTTYTFNLYPAVRLAVSTHTVQCIEAVLEILP